MPRWKPRWKILLIVVVVVILLIVGWRAMHGPGGEARRGAFRNAGNQAPIPVTVEPVVQKNVPIYLTTNGTVQALQTVTVQPQVGGRLLSVNFKGGDEVKKGQVLAQIDPRTYQAAYDQAIARVHSDEAQVATAKGNLASSKQLIKKHYVSQQEVDTQANTVKQLQATVAADKAAAAQARINLDYTKINAPISGLAGIRQVDPGNVVTTSTPIVVLTHVHPINVMFSLPAKDLDKVRAAQAKAPLPIVALESTGAQQDAGTELGGQSVVAPVADTDKVLADDGVLEVINNVIDANTGTFTLKSEFPNKQTELWPGQYVQVQMKINTVNSGLVIPTQAVQRGPDGDYVYLVQKDNTVKMQPVTISGEVGDTHDLVSKGLAAGDIVVTEGQFRLKPGSKVTPLKPGEVPVPALAATAAKSRAGKAPAGKGARGHHRKAASGG